MFYFASVEKSQVMHLLVDVAPLWIKWPVYFNYTLIMTIHTTPEGSFSVGSFRERTLRPKNRPEFSLSSNVC